MLHASRRQIWILALSLAGGIMLTPVAGVFGGTNDFEIIVNSTLYASGQITPGLNQYISDVRAQGYNPILTTQSFASAPALRSFLANKYSSSGLAGAVLVGDLPVPYFERYNEFGGSQYERFASDIYYEDLNGTWSDANANGTLDTHTGNMTPEIFVGRLTTSTLTTLHPGRTEASLLNSYFQKDHAYRAMQLNLTRAGLAYIDNDWASYATTWGGSLAKSVAGTTSIIYDPTRTTAADYIAQLGIAHESVLLAAHSNPTTSQFDHGTGGNIYSADLSTINPQAFFFNLFACSGTDYTSSAYQGGEYVFGTNDGLLTVGSTKTGSMLDFDSYYSAIGTGKTYGAAFEAWWNSEATAGVYDARDMDWFYGMTMVGDPLLTAQNYRPSAPPTLSTDVVVPPSILAPLPSSLWAGLSLLGAMGSLGGLRRRHLL